MTHLPRMRIVENDDAALLAAVVNGDLEALGVLFDRHEPEMRRYLGRMGVSAGDVDDLVQATFLEVIGAAKRFDPQRTARSWLLGIATFMVRRYRRSVRRTIERITAYAKTSFGSPPTPAELAEQDQTIQRFERAFSRLSEKKREVFALVALEGWSGEEAARALNVPLNTVWTRLYHARLELRAALSEDER